jgi:diacylglycerol kinase (ATP)
MNNLKKKIRFIINPISGVSRKKVIEEEIKENIDTAKYDYEIVYTKAANHATELSREAAEKNYDVVVAVGGDGSLNEVSKGLIGTRTVLGIIPAGSGNGFARHMKIPFHTVNAMKVINDGNSVRIDTIKINNETFISIAGVGFDALVAKKYAKAGKRGFWSYLKIITQEYVTYKPKKYILEIDGKKIEKKALLIAFANSSQFGYNTSIAPDADMQDGLLDVCIFEKAPLLETPFITNLLFMKQIDKIKYVEIIKGRNITVKRKRNKIVNIDGEPAKVGKDLTISVIPMSLNVIVPAHKHNSFNKVELGLK